MITKVELKIPPEVACMAFQKIRYTVQQLAADCMKHEEKKLSVNEREAWRDFFDSRLYEIPCHLIPWSDDISEKYGDFIPGTLCTRRNLPHFRFSSSVPGAPDELLELDMADDFVVVAGTGCAAGTLADLMCYFN